MRLTEDQCFRATRSRDPRFDGRIFVGIRSTGIYCRPICPARDARRENMVFFECAAAAEESGFRPCKRCRPETAPGSPAWIGTSSSVARALRLIDGGALDESSLDDVAARLGMTSRHLRRLFVEHVGASPRAVAQTRRAHFARRLIDETDLPFAQIAGAAGFASVRRFNAAVRATFGCAPSDLRRRGARRARGDRLRLRLTYRPPYAWSSLARFLAARAIPGIEVVSADGYRRTVRARDGAAEIEVRPIDGNALELATAQVSDALALASRARRMFDLAADPRAIAAHLRRDSLLAPVLRRRPGVRIPGGWDGFEIGVRAILGQQVTVRGATTLSGRLVSRFGERIGDGELSHLFPTAHQLADADVGAIGIPARRADAIRGFARAVAGGDVRFDGSLALDELVAALTALPGIGPWTAHYVAMRACQEPDAFPTGDLGLRQATSLTARALDRRAESWRPWRAYAALYLWETL